MRRLLRQVRAWLHVRNGHDYWPDIERDPHGQVVIVMLCANCGARKGMRE